MQRLPIAIENGLVAWVQAVDAGATVVWSAAGGHRPAAPFVQLDVTAGPQSIGAPEQRYKDEDTWVYAVRKRATLNLQFFGNQALVRANDALNALERPSLQSILQAAGIACWGSDGPRDITGLMDTRHEGRATLDLFVSYPDPVDDEPGEIRRVRTVGTLGSLTVDRMIDIEFTEESN